MEAGDVAVTSATAGDVAGIWEVCSRPGFACCLALLDRSVTVIDFFCVGAAELEVFVAPFRALFLGETRTPG